HIDGTGEVLEVRPGAQWRVIRIGMPQALAPLVVDKGSIALQGVSLTLSSVSPAGDDRPWFEVSLLPATRARPPLGSLPPAGRVQLAAHLLARHAQRLPAFYSPAPELRNAIEGGSE